MSLGLGVRHVPWLRHDGEQVWRRRQFAVAILTGAAEGHAPAGHRQERSVTDQQRPWKTEKVFVFGEDAQLDIVFDREIQVASAKGLPVKEAPKLPLTPLVEDVFDHRAFERDEAFHQGAERVGLAFDLYLGFRA
ncbi:MAG: hypothetical protein ACRDF6_00240 [bacterium]